MADLSTVLAGNRDAVGELLGAADRTGATWTTPRAPGKWSPSQMVEHVARALDESANVVAGRPAKFPIVPAILRPVLRGLFFNRILRKGVFPRAKTNKPLDPEAGAATPAEARVRLLGALAAFDQACRACVATDLSITTTVFGKVSVVDYARFQELHTRHHRAQLPVEHGATLP